MKSNGLAVVRSKSMSLSETPEEGSSPDLRELTAEAFVAARSAVSSAIDGLVRGSSSAFQAVRDCEQKLDTLDRELDQRLAEEVIRANAEQATELLACMKLMIDLERIGDLIASFAERVSIVRQRIEMDDLEQLTRMSCVLENMLMEATEAFCRRNVDNALNVLRSDSEMDRFRNLLLVRHTENPEGLRGQQSLHVLLMAAALERAGDHAKNLAEEVCHLVTGQTLRHLVKAKDKSVEQMYLDWLSRQNPVKIV